MESKNLVTAIGGFIILSLLIAIIGWVVYIAQPAPPIKDGIITNGRVFKCEHPSKARGSSGSEGHYVIIHYQFELNGYFFASQQSRTIEEFTMSDCEEHFNGKSFPVIYDSANPNNNCILVDSSNFSKYHIPFPDSQKWVSNYIKIVNR